MRRLGWLLLAVVFFVPAVGLLAVAAAVWGLFGSDGSATLPIGKVGTSGAESIVVSSFDVDSSVGSVPSDALTLQVQVRASDEVFVGTASKDDALKYVQGSNYELVTGIDTSSQTLSTTVVPGRGSPGEPDAEQFWSSSASGSDVVLPWSPGSDEVLVITSTGSERAVAADLSVVATVANATLILFGLAALAVVLLVLAILAFSRIFTSDSTSALPTP